MDPPVAPRGIISGMRRLVLALAVVVAGAGTARAGGKKKVEIESTPEGASVYVGDVESGEVCKTPCTISVAEGATLIIALAGYSPKIELVEFERGERAPYHRSYELEAAVGKLVIKGPKGAQVTVDDQDKGTAPVELEVTEGVHAVVLTANGKQIYAQGVEVAKDSEIEVAGPSVAVGGDAKPADGTPGIRKTAPRPPRTAKIITGSIATSIGFRDFVYQGVADGVDNLGPAKEYGEIVIGPTIELWPGTLFGVHALRGLALVGRAQFDVHPQEVTDVATGDALGLTTFWRNVEASVRQRWSFADKVTAEVAFGYLRDQHQFQGDVENIAQVPDADYRSLRLALRASALIGRFEPYAAYDNLIVQSGGALEDRFMGASVNGLRATAGVAAGFGDVRARLEGSLTRYTWTFEDPNATGATDSIKYVSLFVGYAY